MSIWTAAVMAHRWLGDDICECACGEEVGNDHSWSLHLWRELTSAGFQIGANYPTVNFPTGAQFSFT